jgi:hypothetical protein
VFFKAPEPFCARRGALLRGASHEHVGVMGVALCRAGGNPFLVWSFPLVSVSGAELTTLGWNYYLTPKTEKAPISRGFDLIC